MAIPMLPELTADEFSAALDGVAAEAIAAVERGAAH